MNCAYCGTEFTENKSRPTQLYCSARCREHTGNQKRRDGYTPIGECECSACGKTFKVGPLTRYCSAECQRVGKNKSGREYARRVYVKNPRELKKRGPIKGTIYQKRVEKVEKPKRIGTCVVCGVEYEKKHSIQMCCSSECSEVRNAANQRNKRAQDKVNKVQVEREPKPEKEHKFTSRPGTGVVIKRAPDLPDSLFAKCEMCGKEYVKSVQAKGKCPVCRGIYHVDRVTWNHNRMEI
jgi:hypothetical protein